MLAWCNSQGDIRWLYATMASSVLTSGFLGLVLRKAEEPIQIIISRAALGVLGGVLGTKVGVVSIPQLRHLSEKFEADVLYLAGIAALSSVVFHIVGYAFIKAANDSAQSISSRLLDRLLYVIGFKTPPEDKK
jgi:predicted aconitase